MPYGWCRRRGRSWPQHPPHAAMRPGCTLGSTRRQRASVVEIGMTRYGNSDAWLASSVWLFIACVLSKPCGHMGSPPKTIMDNSTSPARKFFLATARWACLSAQEPTRRSQARSEPERFQPKERASMVPCGGLISWLFGRSQSAGPRMAGRDALAPIGYGPAPRHCAVGTFSGN